MSGDENEDVSGRDAVEPDAARYGAAMEAYFERGDDSRREFARKAFLSASSVTRYFKGQRVAPRDFLDKLATFLTDRGTPLTPQERADLERLRTAALAGSTRQGNQILYWKEEATRLAAAKEALTTRWHEERQRDTLDHQRAAEALGALELEIAELRERLEHTEAARAQAETQRDTLRDRTREQDRQLHAYAAYTRENEGELAEQRATIEALRREVGVLRHQVDVLGEEKRRPAPARERVARAATQVTADNPGSPVPRSRPLLGAEDGVTALRYGYGVSTRPAAEVSPEFLDKTHRLLEEGLRIRRARRDPTVDPRYYKRRFRIRRVLLWLGLACVAQIVLAMLLPHQPNWRVTAFLTFVLWGFVLFSLEDATGVETYAGMLLVLQQHSWQAWPCHQRVQNAESQEPTRYYFDLLDPEGRTVAAFYSSKSLKIPAPASSVTLVWVAGDFESPCVIAVPCPTSPAGGESVLVTPHHKSSGGRLSQRLRGELAGPLRRARNTQID
ncbi:helix-turn-helix transcriptional regulator [Streptomyces sp. SID3343]|uniref:helix-turn-helix domain-containing protein n=1 Tax=Streptomyces sp. SID3343 TaxID=2690260 RepID=UPI0013701627|nr:helix-turn-helix transcriptional regulator [Streptomyces sp. SID3343]MYW00651.1 hypothetical protein [Streptomyces sp. SID3343]